MATTVWEWTPGYPGDFFTSHTNGALTTRLVGGEHFWNAPHNVRATPAVYYKELTDLVPGAIYTFSVWARALNEGLIGFDITVDVDDSGSPTVIDPLTTTLQQYKHVFVATDSTAMMVIRSEFNGGGNFDQILMRDFALTMAVGPAWSVFDGTSEQPATARVWDGTNEVPITGIEIAE